MIVFLDSGILGLISSPNERSEVTACQNWILGLLAKGVYVVSSDICDYEIRRSLLLLETQQFSKVNLDRLDRWREVIDFLPLTTHVMQAAAQVWADARRRHHPIFCLKNTGIYSHHQSFARTCFSCLNQ